LRNSHLSRQGSSRIRKIFFYPTTNRIQVKTDSPFSWIKPEPHEFIPSVQLPALEISFQCKSDFLLFELFKMPNCPKCKKVVYFAERKSSLGKDWHSSCLRCERCDKTLTPGGHAEHDGAPYCHRPCYATLFGPSGYGHGGAAASFIYNTPAKASTATN